MRQPFQFNTIFPDLFVYHGAVNTGILRWGERALLIDCDDTLTPERLAELGIRGVERIYCTQHRRPNTAGIYAFDAAVYAPAGERTQFEQASAYWRDWRNRWHLYHCRPGPLAPLRDIPLAGTVREGEAIQWGGFTIGVLDTPGMSEGAVSYVVEKPPSPAVLFSGDVLYGPGQVWDIHSLQKNMGTFSDYHGFLGASKTLTASLEKLAAQAAGWLVPSHGDVLSSHAAAARLTIQRLEQLTRNYAAVSALNFYFPHLFAELSDDPLRMAQAELIDFPDFILPVAATSFAVRSDSGALFLIDCGYDNVLETLAVWKEQGQYTDLEGCWVTHYHDDHVDSLHHLNAPIHAIDSFSEILIHPTRFFLPCISPAAAPVAHAAADGETWRWREFELTALHFPGQTLYHGGLLLRGHGTSVLFSGDSLSPSGLDDYTAGNRNLLGPGLGLRRCVDLLRRHRPDLILNQHQSRAFHYSDEQLDYLEKMLIEREALLSDLLPWEHPNFGTDEGWIRAYPYEIETSAGGACTVAVRASNHGAHPIALQAQAVPPPGWEAGSPGPAHSVSTRTGAETLTQVSISLTIPPGAQPGTYPVAFRVTWGGRYLGQVCHALVKVW